MRLLTIPLFALTLIFPGYSQMAPPNQNGLAFSHIHLNVTDVAAQKKFWIEQFDAKPLTRPGVQGVVVPGMLILFNEKAPEHPTVGQALDHFGFKVRSRDEMVARCRAAGLEIPRVFTGSEGFPNAYVTGPDGVKVEMQEEASQSPRAVAQHLHYLVPDFMQLRAWYVNTFPMPETIRGPHPSADIPGMNFTFAKGPEIKYTTMKGGLIDHIGIEVKNLEVYCRRLTAAGVKLDVPYTKDPKLGFAYAFLTDPQGTYIELTEGLDKY